ncbi:hypothetical protein POSPLADRAFT_1042203 [Postia placenta MAD-698-R-SB12]|uniref:Uncharacterized protein n=1 Tax=Postia placenta MAD-698-R-SB12 TaxID=670580 RepID=A0A1X6NE30_9APHY|nr:hypothetical protein POSPLADRAFT_1042203 [Postia placenta MAD-698-R-SB12]OSX66899.1 hypothetical protein POSPLADRAFT_1042203 [Postia placenta MAD-698-R-SB12]
MKSGAKIWSDEVDDLDRTRCRIAQLDPSSASHIVPYYTKLSRVMNLDELLNGSDGEEAYDGPDAYIDEDDAEEMELDAEDVAEEQQQGGSTVGQILNGGTQQNARLANLTLDDLRRLLGQMNGPVTVEATDEEEEDDDGDDEYYFGYNTEPHWDRSKVFPEVKEPKEKGLELLTSGEFGRLEHQLKSRIRDNNTASILLNRGARQRPTHKEDLTSDLLPNSNGTAVAEYHANAYVGQYSSDSSFYYTCARDFRLHVYDTTAPLVPYGPLRSRIEDEQRYGHATTMKVMKTINAHPGRWTITDSHLSPDNQRMIYASILTVTQSNTVYMTTTLDSSPVQIPIRFADRVRNRRNNIWDYDDEDHFGIWSCKFSADGNEVIAGGSGMIFVYDLLADKRTVKIMAHNDDVNSCCWADTASGNVLVSASDDTFIKVWDRRSLGMSPKPSGVLIGHTEGITYVSAKGDGRYIISNGKDQVLRLWDLRMMRTNAEFEHTRDCSVMQYTGHEVLRTLIRCHFSPAETTGQQYIYSGASDGRIHIWSLDGRIVQILDRSQTLPISFDPSAPDPPSLDGVRRSRICVRDVSWHSDQPILMSAGWVGGRWSAREGSVIARHEWKGLSKMQYSLRDYQERRRQENAERAAPGARDRRAMPGAFANTDDEDKEAAANTQIAPMDADLNTYGFPPGYFIVRSVASNRNLDVELGLIDDGTNVILWPQTETSLVDSMRDPSCDNQVFFIDTSDEKLVVRHRRPVFHPFPNAYSHPLPRFSYDRQTQNITVTFAADPAYPSDPRAMATSAWKEKVFLLTSIPARKPRTIADDASALLNTALATPMAFFGSFGKPSSATPEDVFSSGDIDLREDEILEQDRSEEGEVDDSPDKLRRVRIVALTKEELHAASSKARFRQRWKVIPLLASKSRTRS